MAQRGAYRFHVKFGNKWTRKTLKQIKIMESKLHRKLEVTF